jgi:hypothetical protein
MGGSITGFFPSVELQWQFIKKRFGRGRGNMLCGQPQHLRQLGDISPDAPRCRNQRGHPLRRPQTYLILQAGERSIGCASTPYQPIDAIVDCQERKPRADQRAGHRVNAATAPTLRGWSAIAEAEKAKRTDRAAGSGVGYCLTC